MDPAPIPARAQILLGTDNFFAVPVRRSNPWLTWLTSRLKMSFGFRNIS